MTREGPGKDENKRGHVSDDSKVPLETLGKHSFYKNKKLPCLYSPGGYLRPR